MEQFVKLHIINTSDFEILKWEGTALFYLHEKILSYVQGSLGMEDIFAEPRILDEKRVQWVSKSVKCPVVSLASLRGTIDYEHYVEVLDKKINAIRSLIESMKKGSRDKNWITILEHIIIYGGEDYVYIGKDGQIVITCWGMYPLDNKEKGLASVQHKVALNEKKVSQSKGVIETVPSADVETAKEVNTDPPYEKINDGIDNEKGNSFNGELEGEARKSDRKTWWWLLIPVLLLISFLLYKRCENTNYLPPNVGNIVPIDSEKIGYDNDSIAKIVLDRINILIEGEKPDLHEFGKEFKEAYPQENYSIIYYDTLINRIQLEVPQNEVGKVKNELPKKLHKYQMLIWDESLFENDSRPTDPGFSDSGKRWYIDIIDAYDAWSIT